jgi:hypothetical protein
MKFWKGFGFLAFLGVFGGFHYLLNLDRQVASSESQESTQVIREMAGYIQNHPEIIRENQNVAEPQHVPRSNSGAGPDVPAPVIRDPEVFGIALNRQTLEKLATPEGQAEVQVRMSQNPHAVLSELKQAWKILDPADTERREALQELTVAFRRVQGDPELDVSLVEEVKRVQKDSVQTDARLEYVGRTLQRHLEAEKDEHRLTEQLESLGIPRVVVENPEPGRAPASEETVK